VSDGSVSHLGMNRSKPCAKTLHFAKAPQSVGVMNYVFCGGICAPRAVFDFGTSSFRFRHCRSPGRREAYVTLRWASASRTSPSPRYHRRPACVLPCLEGKAGRLTYVVGKPSRLARRVRWDALPTAEGQSGTLCLRGELKLVGVWLDRRRGLVLSSDQRSGLTGPVHRIGERRSDRR
jgi:hypothetical protein